jgi:cytohesin
LKQLLITTIAAVVLVGCGPSVSDISIHDAAADGNIEALKQHLAAGTDLNAKVDDGETPLHYAAAGGHKEIAELLIAEGSDVNAKSKARETPLHYAAGGGHKETAALLIAEGSDVNVNSVYGYTALDVAIRFKKSEFTDLLRKHGGKTGAWLKSEESIHIAAKIGRIEAVKQHLADGKDVDARDKQDKTPLQHAAYWGHKEIAELLIAKGADINAKDNAGKTTLDWAISGRKKESINLLRKHGGKTGEELEAEGK